jgi:hypothetical protein
MRPRIWRPPIDPTPTEQVVIKRIKRAKLFVFLRQRRHEIFTEDFQEELGAIYRQSPLGRPPIPQRNWLWPPYCRLSRASRMTKSSRLV